MEREVSELDGQIVIGFEFLDTPGDEVAPGSNKVREDFEDKRLWHDGLLMLVVQTVQIVQDVQIVRAVQRSTTDSMVVVTGKSKGLSGKVRNESILYGLGVLARPHPFALAGEGERGHSGKGVKVAKVLGQQFRSDAPTQFDIALSRRVISTPCLF